MTQLPWTAPQLPNKGLAELLEQTPPNSKVRAIDFAVKLNISSWKMRDADPQLHCSSEKCGGTRSFRLESGDVQLIPGWNYRFITYVCRNCEMVRKTYAIAAILQNDDSWTVFKLGEYPPFGPHLPARVISLIGPDREYFLLGRRAETYGLGIAAFAYYRRVVENQKERILSQMAGAAKRLGASTEKIALFERAQAETQFSNAIEILKPAIPATLLIKGQNPLSLLYSPLSKGLHELTDEQCL